MEVVEEEIERKLMEYDWKDLEEALREVQYGMNMLVTYFNGCYERCKAVAVLRCYFEFAEVAKLLRELMEKEGLLSEKDYEEVERRMERKGHTLRDAILD